MTTGTARRRAFTLAEVLVVMFLGVVVLFLIAQLLVPSVLMFRTQSARSDVQGTTLALVRRIQRELMNTSVPTITVMQDPPSLSFQDVRESLPFDSARGQARLEDHFTIYRYDAAGQRVFWEEWPPEPPEISGYDFSDPSRPLALLPAHLKLIGEVVGPRERVVARNVTKFEITDADANPWPLLHPPLTVRVRCVVDASGGGGRERKETFEMEARAMPRNNRW